ncbi:hypothetical protein MSPP1_001804 [Malassezia sp. CBS 17886]|nr:hypothetical protein MSPP1_001804 [Malassezia sp. CBS 17886]
MADTDAFLAARVLQDREVVTYRLLSRACDIHVDDAKAALLRFYEAPRSDGRVGAAFVVHGMDGAVATTLLVDQDEVAAAQSALQRASAHIYACGECCRAA